MNRNPPVRVIVMDTGMDTLLLKARQGDTAAFEELFEPLRGKAMAVACRFVGTDDAEDVVMEAFVKAWQALPGFNGRSSLSTWLYRITHNCALDHLRSRRRRIDSPNASCSEIETQINRAPDTHQPAPDALAERSDMTGILDKAMGELPEEHSTALRLRYCDGLTYGEIAAATGASLGTVMSRLFYGRRKLRRRVEERFKVHASS